MEILSAALTPLIAAITAYIAYQQYRTNRLKLKHELYDRRLSVYRAVIKFFSIVFTRGKISQEELLNFLSETAERYFLFSKDIPEYIEEIYSKGNELLYTTNRLEGAALSQEELEKIAQKNSDLLKWFTDQLSLVKEKFSKYLTLNG